MLTIVIDPSFTYSSLRNTYWLMPSELIFELEMSDWLTVWIDSIDALWWIDLYNCETQVSEKISKILDLVGVSCSFPVLEIFQKQRAISVSWQKIARKWNTKLFSIIGVSGDSCSSARHDKKTRLILILLIRDPRKKNTKYKDGLKIKNCYLYKLLKIFLFFQRI